MNTEKNYYQTLGLDKNSDLTTIKKTYKKLAKEFHPDKNKGDTKKEKRFKEISEAYSILGDKNKKQQYDTQSPHGNAFQGHNNPFGGFGGFGGFDFGGGGDDFFSSFFHGRSPFDGFRQEFKENLDIIMNVIVTMKDVYKSKPIEIKYKRYLHCEECKGTGFDKKSHSDPCEMCNGTGKDNYGRPCEYCQGSGKVFSGTCQKCSGEKILIKDTKFNLNNIHKIRKSSDEYLRGYGHQSKYYRQKRGDLHLKIIFQNIQGYKIENNQLYYDLDLHYKDAIDGVKYELVLLDDKKVKISIPEKTKDKSLIRLKGKGLLQNIKTRGDLIIRINIVIDYDRL